MKEILAGFIGSNNDLEIIPFGNGLIHSTYKVQNKGKSLYILQKLNTAVFKKPLDIADNLDHLSSFLVSMNQEVFFPMPMQTLKDEPYAIHDGGYYRLTPFVPNSHSLDSCISPDQAFEAAFQFGRFTASFEGMNVHLLKPSIPGFHDLAFRWQQFQESVSNGIAERIQLAKKEISLVMDNAHIVDRFNAILQDKYYLRRVTHHDTKINNVLFNQENKGICPIDLDTVMPGYFISDLGDMFRTYLSPGSEEDTDLEKVYARRDFMVAILEGYLSRMSDQLTSKEKEIIPYAGEFMVFMQAIRFLADFLNGDVYYGIRYEMNNFDRTKNQLCLLQSYQRLFR
jgi:hypothetical protein